MEGKRDKPKFNTSVTPVFDFFLAVQRWRLELRQTQHDVRQQRRDEEEREDGRSILVIIQPFRAPRPQPQPSVNEDNGRVGDCE